MLTWIKSLFTAFDRQQIAADRAAVALEDIAADIESARDALRTRLGHVETAPAALAAIENNRDTRTHAGHCRRKSVA